MRRVALVVVTIDVTDVVGGGGGERGEGGGLLLVGAASTTASPVALPFSSVLWELSALISILLLSCEGRRSGRSEAAGAVRAQRAAAIDGSVRGAPVWYCRTTVVVVFLGCCCCCWSTLSGG